MKFVNLSEVIKTTSVADIYVEDRLIAIVPTSWRLTSHDPRDALLTIDIWDDTRSTWIMGN